MRATPCGRWDMLRPRSYFWAEEARKTDKHPSCRAQSLALRLDPIAQCLHDIHEHWQITKYHERGQCHAFDLTKAPLPVLHVMRSPVSLTCDLSGAINT